MRFGDAGDCPSARVCRLRSRWLDTLPHTAIRGARVCGVAGVPCIYGGRDRIAVAPFNWAGLHTLLATAIILTLLSHRYVWQSLVVPEVYAPSLAGLLGSVVTLLRYARSRRVVDLCIAGTVFGFVVVNRPFVALMALGLLLAWVVVERRWGTNLKPALGRLLIAAGCGLVPIVVTATLVIARDTPTARYNYITDHNDGRAAWIMTSVQYRDKLGADISQMRSKWRYLRRQLHVFQWPRFVCVVLLLAAGTWSLSRKSPEAVWIAWGIIVGNLIFVLQYRVHGQAADTLPLVFACVWLIGAGFARVVPRSDAPARSAAVWRTVLASLVFVAAAAWTIYHSETRYDYARHRDATAFLERTGFQALPEGSVVFADWKRSRPLWYARSVLFDRMDVRIVTTRGEIEAELWPEIADRPVFCTSPRGAPEGYHFVRHGVLWRLVVNER